MVPVAQTYRVGGHNRRVDGVSRALDLKSKVADHTVRERGEFEWVAHGALTCPQLSHLPSSTETLHFCRSSSVQSQ